MPLIGFLISATRAGGYERTVANVLLGLAEAGFVEGRNFTIEYCYANEQYDQLPTR